MSAIYVPKLAKYILGGLTGILAVGHTYTRFGGFGYKNIDLRNYETAPNAPIGSADNVKYMYMDIVKTRYVLYDTVEYTLDIYRPEGVTGSNHVIYSCKPINVIRD
jgi:hypothetical protein